MNVRARARDALTVRFDREAFLLAGLFMVVLVPAVYLAVNVHVDIEPGYGGLEGPALGGAWALLEAIFAGSLVALILLFKRLPEWVQKWVKLAGPVVGAFYLGRLVTVNVPAAFWAILTTFATGTFILEVLDYYDLWWVVNNLIALALAIALAPVGAAIFGVEALVVAMVGLSIYDWYFADRNSWMLQLGGTMMRYYLPVLVIIPNRLRFDWSALTADPEDGESEEPEADEERTLENIGVSMGIGTADLALPAMFAAAVATAPSALSVGGVPAAVIGVAVGVIAACFRVRWKIVERDGGAGLPPLATGAIAGYAPFAFVGWVGTLL